MKIRNEVPAWFRDAKFGLFVHWGLYALLAGRWHAQEAPGVAEWIMDTLQIPAAEYETLAAQFDPQQFDADALVRQAKSWGMQYIVFTAKHHEGFAMYRSAHPYNVVDASPCHRDILRELADACHKYDIRLGLYYSQAQDWDDPNGLAAGRDNSAKDFDFYLEHKVKPQLTELLTQYGDIALVWFDTPLTMTAAQSRSLYDLVKQLQPQCLVSGRIGNGLGEYMTTSDNFLPRLPYPGAWELPATLNDTWGYKESDHNWKSADEVLRLLLKVVSRGGNYLLNVGPDAQGVVPPECLAVLNEVGHYTAENGAAIFGTHPVPVYPYELDWAEMTCRPHRLYLHILKPRTRIELPNVRFTALSARVLGCGADLPVLNVPNCEQMPMISLNLPQEWHNRKNYCIEFTIDTETPEFIPLP